MATRTRQIRAGFWAIDLALAAASVFFVVNAAQHLFAKPNLSPPPPIDSPSAKNRGPRPEIRASSQYDGLRKSDLFGALSSSNVAPKKTKLEKLPETKLDLELLGLVAQDGSDLGFAIIREKKKRTEDTYAVGDTIVGDAKVVEIRETEVIISRSGKHETLSMVFTDKGPKGRHGFPRGLRQGFTPPARTSRASTDEAIRVVNENLRYVNRSKLTEEMSQNVLTILDQFRTSPNITDGKPDGINIDSIGSDPISAKAGLKAGDKIKSVNGVRVGSLDEILAQSERFQNAPELRVVIERDGRHRTLVFKIR